VPNETTKEGITPKQQKRPWCQACDVPMWLVGVDNFFSAQPEQARWHYVCPACERKLTLSSGVEA
jgi:hypothetical protein